MSMNVVQKLAIPSTLSGLSVAGISALGYSSPYTDVAVLALFFGSFIYREVIGFAKYYGKEKLNGKTVLITGSNTGIGLETAKDLAKRGARIIIASRDARKNEAAAKQLIEETGNPHIATKVLDLASQRSIRDFCKDINATESRLDVVINNAGIMTCPHMLTKDGIEMQLGVDHIGHFLMVNLLLDKIKASAPSRIVILSSVAHEGGHINFDDLNSERSYNKFSAYGQAKIANVLHALELTRRLKGTGVTANAVHPGVVDTDLPRYILGSFAFVGYFFFAPIRYYFFKTPSEGAQTTIRCAVDPALETVSGKYFADCQEKTASKEARDENVARRLWEYSEKWTTPDKAK